jgi:hypothetical protein
MYDIFTNTVGGIISGAILSLIGFAITYYKNKRWTTKNTLRAITEDKAVRDQIIKMTRSFADRKIFIIGDNQQGRNAKNIIKDMPHLINPTVDIMIDESELEKLHKYNLIIVTESFLRGKEDRVEILTRITGRKIDTQALIAYAPDFNLITHENGFEKAEIPIINGTMNATMNNAQGRLQSDIYALLQTIPSDTPSSTKNS